MSPRLGLAARGEMRVSGFLLPAGKLIDAPADGAGAIVDGEPWIDHEVAGWKACSFYAIRSGDDTRANA